MYSRRSTDGDVLEFGVSGRLWHGVLVMFDRAGGSLWTQLDGRAIRGERLGERLSHVDSTFTTWAEWRAAHPATLVLEKPEGERGQTGSAYADYFASPERLFFDELGEGLGGVGAKELVFGVVVGDDALAIEASVLERERAISAVVGGTPIVVVRADSGGTVRAYERRFDGRVRMLTALPNVEPTTLLADATSGKGLAVSKLRSLRVDRAYWYAWKRTHPESRILAE